VHKKKLVRQHKFLRARLVDKGWNQQRDEQGQREGKKKKNGAVSRVGEEGKEGGGGQSN